MGRKELIIIGAGAAGMMAAVAAANCGVKVLILEKMEKAGRKIRITGKGRCNITNTKEWKEFSGHVHPKCNFFKPAFFNFSNSSTMSFFENIGIPLVVERGDRVFPASGSAKDVVDSLVRHLESLDVEILFNSVVREICVENNSVCCVKWEKQGRMIEESTQTLIIATGGLSYPTTGSDGDGLKFSKNLGHSVTQTWPSLTALMPNSYDMSLEGLLLKNVAIELYVSGVPIQKENGDIEFTNNGMEGPIGFKISRNAVKSLISGSKIFVVLDFKPALTVEQIVNRIKRELSDKVSIKMFNLLSLLLPKQIISYFMISSKIDPDFLIGAKDENMFMKIAKLLKFWRLDIESFTSYERAVVTAGGVSLEEISSKSMKSKLYSNLFFAGEVIDLDADTGGYNLQIAFSTGYLAGVSAAHLILKLKQESPE